MAEPLPGYSFDLLDDDTGTGTFGTVYKGLDKDKKPVAIKRVGKEHKTDASTEAVKSHFIKKQH